MTSGLSPTRPGHPTRPAPRRRRSASTRRVSSAEGGVRFLAWTSDDGRRSETARVVLTSRGLRATGTIIALGDRPCGTSYALLCDATGRTRRITVRTESPTLERGVALTRAPHGPWLDGIGRPPPHPELDQAIDVDLASSVFTVGLAVRRLGLHRPDAPTGSLDLPVARISTPDLDVRTVLHRLRVAARADGITRVDVDGPDGPGHLSIDADGFVVDIDDRDTTA